MLVTRDEIDLEQAASTLKLLGDTNRLRIVTRLAERETCVCDLIDDLDLPQPLVSYHLGKLRRAGLVQVRRDAQWLYYSLDPGAWHGLRSALGGLLTPSDLPPAAAFGASMTCPVPQDAHRYGSILAEDVADD